MTTQRRSRIMSALLALSLVCTAMPPAAFAQDAAPSAADSKKAPRTPSAAKISFDFTDYDLGELVKKVSEMTGRNFILTEPLQGKKVTIMSPTKITVEEAYQVFLSVLRSSGYTTVPVGRSLKIVPLAQVASEPIPTQVDPSGQGENFVTRLYKVDNIDVDQISGALSRFVSPNGGIITYAPTNTLIITDTPTNIERILDIVNRLDVESPVEQLVIIPIRYAAAQDIADKLAQVYGDAAAQSTGGSRRSTTSTPTPANRRNRNQPAQGQAAPGASTGSIGSDAPSISKIIADERTNSLIVMATTKALEDITALISKLDVDVDENLKSDIHVIYLKYAKAEELASTLSNLAGGGGGGGSVSNPRNTSTSRNNTSSRSSTSSRTQSQNTRTQGRTSSGFGGMSGGGDATATFEGGVRVTADAPTNALVITASYNDYRTLKRVIEMLDVRRRQVFVEAVILELSQSRNLNVGLNYHGGVPGDGTTTSGALIARGSQSLLPSDANLLAGLAVGLFGITIDAPSALSALNITEIPAFGVVLQALQSDKDVNILSTPSILTSNNQEAKIVVGQNVPFQSGSTISTIGSNVSISREDVALTLRVTPQVNESNEVTLEVFQEITEVVPGTTSNILGPTTTKRSAETVVSVPDNQTVVIGGLISTKENAAEDKIPVLGDLPLIGFLFRTKSKTLEKSNLLVFLTPHIIDTEEDLMNVYRVKMAQRQEFIRRFYGKSREEQILELNRLMRYSMNVPDQPPVYPEREQARPLEQTIETNAGQRGFIAPIPGAEGASNGPVIVPVLPSTGQKSGTSSETPAQPQN